jgi:hypothetical protein
MARNSNLLSRQRRSLFSTNIIPDNYQAITGMINSRAYAEPQRDALCGGIAAQPEQLTNIETTLIVGQSLDGYLSYYLLNYENKVITDTVKLEYQYYPDNGDDTSMHPLNYGGYMIELYRDDENDRVFIFIDVNGNVVESYDSSNNSNWDILDGRWVYFIDYDGGVAKFYNGNIVITKNFDTNFENLNLYWDWDATSNNGSILIGLENNNTNQTSIIKLDQDGTETQILTFDNANYDYYISNAYTGDFSVFLLRDIDNNNIVNLSIYSHKTNTFVQNVVLIDQNYNNWNYYHYDSNKHVILMFDGNDSDVDYKIIQYDGNTNTLINASHVKGTNYPNYNTYAESFDAYGGIDSNPKNASILFYNNDGQLGDFDELIYADFVTFIDGSNSADVYTFSDDESGKYISFNTIRVHEYVSAVIQNGDGNLSVLTLNGDTNPTTILGAFPSIYDENSINSESTFGSNYFIGLNNVDTESHDLFIINNSGSIADSLLDISGYYYETSANLLYVGNNNSQDEGWYYNDSVNSFTSIGYYDSSEYPYYKTEDGYAPRHILLYNSDGIGGDNNCRILGDTFVTDQITLPESNNTTHRVGKNNFLRMYERTSDSQLIIEVYDFTIQLVNSIVSEFNYNTADDLRSRYYGNRGIVWAQFSAGQGGNDQNSYQYLVTPETIIYSEKSMFNNNNDSNIFAFNDIVSENDW